MTDAQADLLERIVADRPDISAWRSLAQSCDSEYGPKSVQVLAGLIAWKLGALPRERGERVVRSVAKILATEDILHLAALLAMDAEPTARHLALELLGRLSNRWTEELLQTLRGLFLDRRLPERAQLRAAASLLRAQNVQPAVVNDFLQTLVSGLGKERSIQRLRRLERRVGKAPAIDALCEKLEDQLRMSCPRCGEQLRRPEMIRHLWEAHRAVLVGRKVKEPWPLVEEWIDAWKAGGPAQLLANCRNLAQHLEPEQGLHKVNRLILARGKDDPEARQFLGEAAEEQHASLCPRCFALMPMPRGDKPWALMRRGGRLSSRGYLVDISEQGMRTRLEVRTPARLVYLGTEPTYAWTFRGAVYALAGPFVLLALACAIGTVQWANSPLSPVLFLLGVAALVYGVVHWEMDRRPTPAQRVLHHAWNILAPRLHEDGFQRDDASFLAALADLVEETGDPPIRKPVLPSLLEVTQEAVGRGEGEPFQLAALWLRQIADVVNEGGNPEDEVARLLGQCFEGHLPLSFGDQLLEGWRKDWRTQGTETRLRILLCDRGFESGFEVRQLLDAGQTAPALGELLRVSKVEELASLRLLWSLRPSRPWERFGPVLTAFDLAADPTHEPRLTVLPDVLFYQTDPDWPLERDDDEVESPFRIVVRASGLMIQGELFTEAPGSVRVKGRLEGSDLFVGAKRFHSEDDLTVLGDRVEQWIWYYFTQFRPKLSEVAKWKAPDKAALWRAWGAMTCPECGDVVLPRLGNLAVPVEANK